MNESLKEQNNKKKPLRKYILTAEIVVLLIISALVFSLFQPEPKPDPASEALIRQEAAKNFDKNPNDMTDEDFAQIHSFTLGENMYASMANPIELCDIKLLEKFTGLEWLSLGKISYPRDKIPLWMIMLAKFGIYDLNEKYVLDLSPLKNLDNLLTLIICNMPIKSIKPLSSLTNLQILFIVNTNITDEQVEELQKALPELEIRQLKYIGS
ncbi:MAG: hypothetical protein JXA96_08980 [Sedimentisphaerales bacterium]|nr:hypothetical protein [Sedimentisphaerales bacterium]